MKNKLDVVIIDDEPLAIELLKDYVERHNALQLSAFFSDGHLGLSYIKSHPVDLLLLDIHMPDIDGLTLASQIEGKCQFVFTTAHTQHALKGFELRAADYLHKPFSFERFSQAIDKTLTLKLGEAAQAYITIKCDGENRRLSTTDIVFVEAAKKYVAFHCMNETLISLMSLSGTLELLQPLSFVRIHKSYIVNTDFVESFDSYEVKLPHHQLPLGDTYKKAFFALFS